MSICEMCSVYKDFGAHLWSSNLSKQLDVIPMIRTLYHSIGRPWSDGIFVLKPMNRVSDLLYFDDCGL